MYKNTAKKLKILAPISAIVGILFSLYVGLAIFFSESIGLGLICGFLGIFSSIVISFLIYGFGVLVENSSKKQD
jgi:hypothetical protein